MKKRTAVKILVVVLALSLMSGMILGCKKKKSAYQEWKEVLKEYDQWTDEYIAFMKKYKSNSSDYSLLNDYSRLMSEYSQWANKLAKIEKDDSLSTTERNEILLEYNRITQKLTKALY